jgi:prepilin-type N-terminal cleavage/methylation domain-containing protein
MRNQSGFTLTEVLLAMIILGFVISGLLVLHKSSWSNTRGTSRLTKATYVAEKEIERMRARIAQASAIPANAPGDTIIENFTVKWILSAATDLADPAKTIHQQRICTAQILVISRTAKPETLSVRTYLTKDF